MAELVARARELTESLLFPSALTTDASPLVPRGHLDALAEAGLYGAGETRDLFEVAETLASGCLSTTFVWLQHIGATFRASAGGHPLVPLLRTGERRAGIAITSLLPGHQTLRASEGADGWVVDGTAPWYTGWGLTDTVQAAAMTDDGRVAWLFLDASDARLSATPLRLVAANASGTVELGFHHARADLIEAKPYEPPPAYDGGGRFNGSLALGVIRRCCVLLEMPAFDRELDERRAQLDAATDETMALARAAACELAVRASAALVVARGSRSILLSEHAQRLAREATFVLAFGSRPATRASVLERLSRASRG